MTQSKEHNSQCDFSLGILRMDTRKLTSSVAQHKTGMSKNLWMVRLLSRNVHKAAAILKRRERILIFFIVHLCFYKQSHTVINTADICIYQGHLERAV